jgi:hypothetical protein
MSTIRRSRPYGSHPVMSTIRDVGPLVYGSHPVMSTIRVDYKPSN